MLELLFCGKYDVYFYSMFEDIFVVLMVYSFLKLTLLGALVELIWPTQFFNKRNTQGVVNSRLRTYVEFLMKLRNTNVLVSFKLILVNIYNILVSHKNVLQKILVKKIKHLSVQNLYKLFNFFQKNQTINLFFLLNCKQLRIGQPNVGVIFLLFFFLSKSCNLFFATTNVFTNTNVIQHLVNIIVIPRSFFKNTFVVNLTTPSVSFNRRLLVIPTFNSSSLNKHISQNNLSSVAFQFLRKNKVFNKGRYSRCRQNYRTGVYICMYLSVVCIFGLYFWFYKFSFNFTYLWWFFVAFIGSFFVPKIIKFRFYEPKNILNKFVGVFNWSSQLIKSFFS